MLLRHKEESAEELAGFTEAVRACLQTPKITVDLDCPSYAGKKRHLPWYLLAAKCLGGSGTRILLHSAGRLYTEQIAGPAWPAAVPRLGCGQRSAGRQGCPPSPRWWTGCHACSA